MHQKQNFQLKLIILHKLNMSIDAKRDEFRRYLEQTGVMEALTRALVQLMELPEKPPDAVAYLRDILPGNNKKYKRYCNCLKH